MHRGGSIILLVVHTYSHNLEPILTVLCKDQKSYIYISLCIMQMWMPPYDFRKVI